MSFRSPVPLHPHDDAHIGILPPTGNTLAKSKLSERSLFGGRSILPRLMTDFSEKRLVRRISVSLGEDSDTSTHDDVTDAEGEDSNEKRGPQAALVHRKELVVGRLLGQGCFSQVKEVRKFCWKDDLYLTDKERRRRNRLQRGSYAVKHLNRTLLKRPKEFYQAALELAREAQYMSVLSHPNVLKARAISYGGAAARKYKLFILGRELTLVRACFICS